MNLWSLTLCLQRLFFKNYSHVLFRKNEWLHIYTDGSGSGFYNDKYFWGLHTTAKNLIITNTVVIPKSNYVGVMHINLIKFHYSKIILLVSWTSLKWDLTAVVKSKISYKKCKKYTYSSATIIRFFYFVVVEILDSRISLHIMCITNGTKCCTIHGSKFNLNKKQI